MSKAVLKNFPLLAVNLRASRRSFICIFFEFFKIFGQNQCGPENFWPFPNTVKNDKNDQKSPKIPKFCQFERLSQNNWPCTTFWPILSPIGSKKSTFWTFEKFWQLPIEIWPNPKSGPFGQIWALKIWSWSLFIK